MTEQERIEQLEKKVELLEKTIEELKNELPSIAESVINQKITDAMSR